MSQQWQLTVTRSCVSATIQAIFKGQFQEDLRLPLLTSDRLHPQKKPVICAEHPWHLLPAGLTHIPWVNLTLLHCHQLLIYCYLGPPLDLPTASVKGLDSGSGNQFESAETVDSHKALRRCNNSSSFQNPEFSKASSRTISALTRDLPLLTSDSLHPKKKPVIWAKHPLHLEVTKSGHMSDLECPDKFYKQREDLSTNLGLPIRYLPIYQHLQPSYPKSIQFSFLEYCILFQVCKKPPKVTYNPKYSITRKPMEGQLFKYKYNPHHMTMLTSYRTRYYIKKYF